MENIEYKGYNINIKSDEYGESPREWDNLGTMVCFHKKYDLGDKHNLSSDSFNSWDEMEEHIKKEYNTLIVLPLFLYDHSSISLRTYRHGQHSSWDCGQVGFLFVEKEKVKKEWNVKKFSAKLKKQIEKTLLSELDTYDNHIRGEVYSYCIVDQFKNDIDSCGGFYGYEHEENGLLEYAKNAIDCHIEVERKSKQERIKNLIKNKVELAYR